MRECVWWNCTGRKRNTVCMCLCRRWVTGERDNGVENRMQQVMGVYSIGSEVAKPFLTSGFRTHRRNIKPFRPLNKKFNWFTILPLGLTHIHVVCHPCFPALEYPVPVLLLRKCDETGVCFLRSKIKGKCWSHVRKHIRTERTNDVVLLRRDEWACGTCFYNFTVCALYQPVFHFPHEVQYPLFLRCPNLLNFIVLDSSTSMSK